MAANRPLYYIILSMYRCCQYNRISYTIYIYIILFAQIQNSNSSRFHIFVCIVHPSTFICMYLVAWQIPEEWTRMLMQNFQVHVCMYVHMFLFTDMPTYVGLYVLYVCPYMCMVLWRFQEPAEVASLNKTKTCKCECECFVFTAFGQTG